MIANWWEKKLIQAYNQGKEDNEKEIIENITVNYKGLDTDFIILKDILSLIKKN